MLRFLIGLIYLITPLTAKELILKDSQGMDCYVYLPDKIDPSKTYQLFVGVHGAGGKGKGKGAAGYASWASRGDIIVMGPSFVSRFSEGIPPYQNGNGPHAKKLIELFSQLNKTYRLKPKMFLYGFSGGAQFAHRFTMLHPELVCGVSAHSGGSWVTRNFGTYNPKAKHIPFAISCGENDKKKAFSKAPIGRLEWFEEFRKKIDQDKFWHIAQSWPKTGHRKTAGVKKLTAECFQLATGIAAGADGSKVEISAGWKHAP